MMLVDCPLTLEGRTCSGRRLKLSTMLTTTSRSRADVLRTLRELRGSGSGVRARAWRRYRPGAIARWRLNARENEYSER